MRILVSFVLTALLAMSAGFASADTFEPAINVTFPDEVAGLPFSGRVEFPQKELGVNITYQRSGPVRGSVFIYTGGLGNIPSGVDSAVVRQHFSQVIADVKMMETLGKVRSVKFDAGGDQVTAHAGCGPQFIWRRYEIEMPGATLTSFTYLTAMRGNFVKLRISFPKGDSLGERDAGQFVRQIRKVLGECKG